MTGWRIAFIVAHIIEIIVIWTLLKDYHFVDQSLYQAVETTKSSDALHVAVQLGRFDMISIFFAGVSILIGIAAIFGFAEVRSRSEKRAEEAAKPIAAQIARSVAENEIRPEANRLIEDWFERKGIDVSKLPKRESESAASEDINQNIADAFEDKP
ncbi:hypothetical protein [Rhizobium phaseoli]|uniref:hypothetical protein n=1 Tax=Rhizobium phaseoli TaxID=396 RepID=UPI0007EB0DB3|nr:hypothetical protein [Rhizobium phaseoli]ANL52884.1 hypothetical protein AMC86_CH01722 [Rhizobium phaseoli]